MKNAKRYIIPLLVVLFLVLAAITVDRVYYGLPDIPQPSDSRAQPVLQVIPITLPDGTRIAAEVARTDREKTRGLMFRTEVPPATGMLFVHKNVDYHQIWMKNTRVSLDVIFIGDDNRIVALSPDVPVSPPDAPDEELARRTGYCRYVLEMKAGEIRRLGLKKKMHLSFSVE